MQFRVISVLKRDRYKLVVTMMRGGEDLLEAVSVSISLPKIRTTHLHNSFSNTETDSCPQKRNKYTMLVSVYKLQNQPFQCALLSGKTNVFLNATMKSYYLVVTVPTQHAILSATLHLYIFLLYLKLLLFCIILLVILQNTPYSHKIIQHLMYFKQNKQY